MHNFNKRLQQAYTSQDDVNLGLQDDSSLANQQAIIESLGTTYLAMNKIQ